MKYLRYGYGGALKVLAFFLALLLVLGFPSHWFVALLPSSEVNYSWAKLRFALFIKTCEALSKLNQSKLLQELLLESLKDFPRWKTKHVFGSIQTKKPKFLLDPSLKLSVFNDAYAIIESIKVRPFICFGLLLGHVREKGFMAHDLDFDFGLFYEPGLVEKCKKALEQAKYQIEIFEPSPWPCRLVALHKPSGIRLDLVFFKKEQGAFLTYTRYKNHLLKRERKPFELEETQFANRIVLMPASPELFLTENYGNWKEKSEYHHWIVTSPLTDFSEPILQPLLLSAIFHNLFQHQYKSAKQLVAKWNAVKPKDKLDFNV